MERCDGPSNFVYARDVRYCCQKSERSIAGFALGRVAADQCGILSLAVAIQHRGARVGGLLLDGAIHQAAEGGAETLFLEVAEDNNVARTLYHVATLRQGRRPNYYARKDGTRRRPLLCLERLGSALFIVCLIIFSFCLRLNQSPIDWRRDLVAGSRSTESIVCPSSSTELSILDIGSSPCRRTSRTSFGDIFSI